jgi:hypothetical protein
MEIKITATADLKAYTQDRHLRLAKGARIGAERMAAAAKLAYRQSIRTALGDRVANALRVDIYPKSAAARTHAPAVFVSTKAPKIIEAFSYGATIKNREGFWLAIPTENTPRRGGRRATPLEVEGIFNQDLIFFPGRRGQMLAFVDVVRAKSGKGFRKSTRQRTKDGRQKEIVLMFVMVRQVTLKQRIRWDQITADLGAEWPDIFGSSIAAELSR